MGRKSAHSILMTRPARLAIAMALVALACTPPDERTAADSPASAVPPEPTVPTEPANAWPPALGSFLVVPAETDSQGIVIFPDATPARRFAGSAVTLVNGAGDTASVSAFLDTLQCGNAPVLRFSAGATGMPVGWWIGFHGSSGQLIPTDSIEALPEADSIRIGTALARIASSSPTDPEFRGLPFAIARARRFAIDDRVVVVAHLVRRVPQEDAPLEEHTFVIAERDATPGSPFQVAFTLRSDGTEETAEHFEALAVMRDGDRVLLILARDRMLQTTYQVLTRSADGRWMVTWARGVGC